MADLQKPIRQMEQNLGEVSREILRIEAHLRRGEQRAASARIDGARQHLSALRSDYDTAMQLTVVGAQLGLMSGGGNWLRGRIPAAILFGVAGWMYGQSLSSQQNQELEELSAHLDFLESQLDSPSADSDTPSSTGSPAG